MILPKKIITAFKAGYRQFSWVESRPILEISPLDLFAKGQNNYHGRRFYWQTPKQDLCLIGVGNSTLTLPKTPINSGDNTLSQVFTTSTISATGPILCGGLAFNSKHLAPEIWGELDQGVFFIPKLLVTVTDSSSYLTLNFSAETLTELETTWQALQLEVATWFEEALPITSKAHPLLKTEELAVDQWLELVNQTIATLKKSTDLTKIVLARQLKVTSNSPWQGHQILQRLQQQQLNTYIFALEAGQHLFIGATPEKLLHATETSYTTACIAGSIARGKNEQEDTLLGEKLLNDIKNQDEHQIVVDQIAADLEEMIENKLTPLEPTLLKNRDIQHLHVPLTGTRKPGSYFLDGVKQLHPTPALGGQPQELACAYIAKHEPNGRGMYGAPIGWHSPKTDCGEFAVGIRSGVFSENYAYLYAGCGIVTDSIAVLEREETSIKFQPMLRAIGGMTHDTSNNND